MPLRPNAPLACFLLLPLAACVEGQGAFPSLAPRPIEQAANAPVAPPAAPVVTGDPALDARVAALLADAERGEADFRARLPDSCAAWERGANAAEGSEAWIAAQTALSALGSARDPTVAALSDLDALVLERMQQSGVDLSGLIAAEERVGAMAQAQRDAMDALSAGSCPR